MILHAACKMHTKIIIHTVDTDVVVLAIANAYKVGIGEQSVLFRKEKSYVVWQYMRSQLH